VRPQLRQRFRGGSERAIANVDLFLEMALCSVYLSFAEAFCRQLQAGGRSLVRPTVKHLAFVCQSAAKSGQALLEHLHSEVVKEAAIGGSTDMPPVSSDRRGPYLKQISPRRLVRANPALPALEFNI
jgi:hypothetical protein